MSTERGRIRTEDGLDLFYQAWKPDLPPAAAIAIVHGYAEHGGRYRHLARFLNQCGISVYACDLRGHGRSPGQRGHIERFTDYLLDADAFLRLVRREQDGSKPFLLGHSMGGLIAVSYAEQRPEAIAGLMLSSPFLRMKMAVPFWKRLLGVSVSCILPRLVLNRPGESGLISHDPTVVMRCRKDPLTHGVTTPRWFTETLAAQKRVMRCEGRILAPVLIQYAGSDGIADPQRTLLFSQRLPVADKTVIRYDGFYHEIINEIGKELVYNDMAKWLLHHAVCKRDLSLPSLAEWQSELVNASD